MSEATKRRKVKKDSKGKKKGKKKKPKLDRHYLYTAAVQSVEADIEFFQRLYKKEHGKSFTRFREDFCGTAVLAHEWVSRGDDNEAWGVDMDGATLDWSRERLHPRLGDAVERIHLIQGDVLEVECPPVEVICALNFSYCVFKTRKQLGDYFRRARAGLDSGGILVLDAWGGTEAMCEDSEKRKVDSETAFDGTKIPGFTYYWDQVRFNPIDHHTTCQIHFRLKNGKRLNKAFTYDWRLWMLPELQELMAEAGFSSTRVYVEGWDDDEDEPDGIFRRKRYFENMAGWVAYVVGLT